MQSPPQQTSIHLWWQGETPPQLKYETEERTGRALLSRLMRSIGVRIQCVLTLGLGGILPTTAFTLPPAITRPSAQRPVVGRVVGMQMQDVAPETDPLKLSGSCECRACKFRVRISDQTKLTVVQCHCAPCRRHAAAAYVSW